MNVLQSKVEVKRVSLKRYLILHLGTLYSFPYVAVLYMIRLAVFGASGKTGVPFLQQALANGHHIKALIRNPYKLQIKHDNLEIIKGDAYQAEDVLRTVRGTDAVISLLGQAEGSPKDIQSMATSNILHAMRAEGIQRLISLTGAGVRYDEHDEPKFIDKLIPGIMMLLGGKHKAALLDGRKHAEIIKKSGLKWTIVRGPMLTEDDAKERVEVGYVGKVKGIKLTREDLARFILVDCLEEDNYVQDMPMVTNG